MAVSDPVYARDVIMLGLPRSSLTRYGLAVASVVVSVAFRLALDPWLGGLFPSATLFLAILVVAGYLGRGPALLATGLGAIASLRFFISPGDGSTLHRLENQAGLLLYLLVGFGIALLGGALHEARRRVEALAAEDVQHRDRMRSALDAARMVAWEWNPADGSLLLSENAAEMFGLPQGTTLLTIDQGLSLVHPGDLAAYRERYQKAIAERASYLIHYRLVRPDNGKVLWIEERGQAVCNESGTVERLVGMAKDMTTRKRAEDDLIKARSRLDAILSSSEIGTWEFDFDREVIRADAQCARMFAVSPEVAEGGSLESYTKAIHPDDQLLVKEAFGNALRTRGSYKAEYRVTGQDGIERWVLARGRYEPQRSPESNVFPGVVVEITAQKRAEAELRDARSRLESTLVAGEIGTWEFDVVHNVVRSDSNLARMFELPPEAAAGGPLELYTKSIHPEDRQQVVDSIRQGVESGTIYEEEFRIALPGAAIRWVVARGRIEQDEAGQSIRMPGVVVDITLRKQAEEHQQRLAEEAAAANAKFRAFFDQGALFAGIMDLDGTVIESNRLAWEGSGYTCEQVIGKPFWDGPWWTTSPAVSELVKSATIQAAAGEAFREEIPYFIADGGERILDLLVQPIKDEAGRVVFLASTGTDITDRKRAEIALRQSEERFRYLADAMPQLVWITRPDRSVEYVNRRWIDYTGQASSECIDPADWASVIHPDDIETVAKASLRSHAQGEPFEAEYRIKDATGAYRWHLGRSVPIFDDEGRFYRRFGAATDIDDRRRAEQGARFLAEASAALAGIVDEVSTLRKVAGLAVPCFADWAVVDMLGPDGSIERLAVAHADPSKADLAFEVHRRFPADPSAAYGPANVIRTGRSEFVHEYTNERLVAGATNEDHVRLILQLGLKSYLCVPLLVRGEILGVLGFASAESGRFYDEHDLAVAEDLASRAAIAIENARLYGELKEADRMKDEFLATLAHELRNPLAPIRNALHLMKNTTSDGQGDANEAERAMAERQVVHLTRLIDDLMDVARISRGKIELQKDVVDLATIVNQAVETSRPQIEERRHRLTVSLPEAAIRLEADPTRLEQVLWNLLNNAAKYSEPEGQIDLTVESHGAEVAIRLKDSGIGIKPEMLVDIFEMFTQVDDHRNRAGGGLGIGLGLVRALVEMHGGSITAQSDGPGLGSEFVIKLPVLMTIPAIEPPSRTPEARTENGRLRRRILVVDDNEDAAKSLARLLTRLHGQDVRVAHDGPAALEAAEAFRPEMILLDIGLPGLDGNEVARSIRSWPWAENLVMIALTGWGQEEDRRRSEEAGFDHHFVKPVDPTLLEQLLA